jgi:CRISPR-associated protein Cas1
MLKSPANVPADFGASDDRDWFERSEYWSNYRPITRGRRKKFKYREPLILCGHGVRIRIDHNTLLIRSGFTHYPQKSEEIRFFPGDGNLPDRIIILDGDGGITFDALNWMAQQKIIFAQLNYRGRVNFICGDGRRNPRPELVRWQLSIRDTDAARIIQRKIIRSKLIASIETISGIFPNLPSTEIGIFRISREINKLEKLPKSASVGRLLGLEGAAAAEYFRAWHAMPLKWTQLSRRPIPARWHSIGSRQMAWQKGGNNARHPLNAMLNYGYGMLISQVHAEIVGAGYDPAIGITHGRHTNPIPLVYDLMEPMRPVVDRKVLEFSLSHTFTPGDFTINSQGGCRLNPQSAKALANEFATVGAIPEVNGLVKRLHRPKP